MIGHLCKELDTLDAKRKESTLLLNLHSPDQPSNIRLLQTEIDALPSNPRLRLEVIFGLTDILMQDEPSIRFQDTFWSFVSGIATPIDSPPGRDVEHFLQAEQSYHLPFFERFPFILENYLVNYMFQNLFPYGRAGSAGFISQSLFAEYLQMTTQFAWINALLIGVAGYHKQAFATEHVVKTIQSFTRSVEHYPHLLKSIDNYRSSRDLNSLQGMAIMLKH